jgi:hypothetical protein
MASPTAATNAVVTPSRASQLIPRT